MSIFWLGAYVHKPCLIGITTAAARIIAVVTCARGVMGRSTGPRHEMNGKNHHRPRLTFVRSNLPTSVRQSNSSLSE